MDFTNSKLYGLSNKKYLSELLNLDLKTLKDVKKYYTVKPFYETKNGKKRELYNPSIFHKDALKKIVKMLSFIGFPEYLCGGIPQVSYIDNAEKHLTKNYLLLLDISNFFPNTNDSYVYSFFYHTMNQPEDIAKILTNLTTVRNGSKRFLPQGFPTSPILSFLSYHKMYEKLSEFSVKNNLIFSAYYDDFTFSSDKFIDPRKRREAIKIIEKYNLKVNNKKTRLVINNYTRVTGVIINGNTKKAPKSLHKKMFDRYMKLLDMDKEPQSYTKDDFIDTSNSLQGCIAAIQNIERENEAHLLKFKYTLKYMRVKYDIPVEKRKKELYFRTIDDIKG